MGTTLTNGVYLPNEGERNCYAGLKTNWEILDQKVADVTALQQAVAGALHREIVESLPTTDIDPNTIYMVLSGTSATENVYNEYMYVNNAWELIGTSATDLTNYYTKSEVDGKLLLKANASDLTSHTGDTTIHVTTADKNRWNNQSYVFRYSSTTLVASSTNSNALLDNTDNLKVGDKVIDSSGVLFSITAIDTANSTFTIGTALIDLALDSDVVHKSGNETITGEKNFQNTSTDYSGIKLEGSRVCHITADHVNDGVFPVNDCSFSLLLPDSNKTIHVGRWTSSNNRIFLDKSYPYMSFSGGILRSNTFVPTGETNTALLRLMAQLNFADNTNKNVDIRLVQYDSAYSALYSNTDNVTSLGVASRRWSKIYGTEYYYGSNNVEFSTKFVTTDTNQTISGVKTLSNYLNISNTDTTADTPNIYLRNYKASRETTDTAVQTIMFSDKNAKALTLLESRRISNGNTATNILTYNTDDSNNTVSGGIAIIKGKNDTSFAPSADNAVTCGRTLAKWSDVQTYKVNALEPSSLSLPSGNANNVIDISSYITALDGTSNSYTVPANGWISISVIGTAIDIVSSSWSDSRLRASSGNVRMLYPVLKNETVDISIIGTTLTYAHFIPCQGNV